MSTLAFTLLGYKPQNPLEQNIVHLAALDEPWLASVRFVGVSRKVQFVGKWHLTIRFYPVTLDATLLSM